MEIIVVPEVTPAVAAVSVVRKGRRGEREASRGSGGEHQFLQHGNLR
jgi:hypothetical protein